MDKTVPAYGMVPIDVLDSSDRFIRCCCFMVPMVGSNRCSRIDKSVPAVLWCQWSFWIQQFLLMVPIDGANRCFGSISSCCWYGANKCFGSISSCWWYGANGRFQWMFWIHQMLLMVPMDSSNGRFGSISSCCWCQWSFWIQQIYSTVPADGMVPIDVSNGCSRIDPSVPAVLWCQWMVPMVVLDPSDISIRSISSCW